MSPYSFDALETTLRQLTEIVERNHAQQTDTSLLVQQMTNLVDEMKAKNSKRTVANFAPPPVVVSVAMNAAFSHSP